MTIEVIETLEKRAETCVSCGHVARCYACTRNGLSSVEILTAIREWRRCEKILRAKLEKSNETLDRLVQAIVEIIGNEGCPPDKDCARGQNCNQCYKEWLLQLCPNLQYEQPTITNKRSFDKWKD